MSIVRKISELASDVATLMGESLLLECEPAESPFPDLKEQVRTIAPAILSDLISESRAEELMDVSVNFHPAINIDSDGVGTIECPDDFQRLLYLRMSGWKRAVTTLSLYEGIEGVKQCSNWKGIRGNAERPVAILSFGASGQPCLHLYSCSPGADIVQAYYVRRPGVSSTDTIEIPAALYPALLKKLTESFVRK